jgi:hypothetical protein
MKTAWMNASPMLKQTILNGFKKSDDPSQFGPKGMEIYNRITTDASDPDHISDPREIIKVAHAGGLNPKGLEHYLDLQKKLNDPANKVESKREINSMNAVKEMVMGSGIAKDPKGEQIFAHAQSLLLTAIEQNKKDLAQGKGIPEAEFFDPGLPGKPNPKWVGNVAKSMVRDPVHYYDDLLSATLPDNGSPTKDKSDTGYGIMDMLTDTSKPVDKKLLEGDFKNGKYEKDKAAGMAVLTKAARDGAITRKELVEYYIKYGYARAQ